MAGVTPGHDDSPRYFRALFTQRASGGMRWARHALSAPGAGAGCGGQPGRETAVRGATPRAAGDTMARAARRADSNSPARRPYVLFTWAVNEHLAEIVQEHPARFAALADVPLQGADAAAAELEYCVKSMGIAAARSRAPR